MVDLHTAAIASLLKQCHQRRYGSRAYVFRPGDRIDTLHFVVEGSVAIVMPEKSLRAPESQTTLETDQDVVLSYSCRGEFLGAAGFFLGEGKYEVNAITREPTVIASLAYARLRELLKTALSPHASEILLELGRQLALRLVKSDRRSASLAVLDVSDRIVHALKELCTQADAMTHPDGMQVRITRQELGRLVGCSREMAGRVLKQLERERKISAKGKTIVVFGTR
jgi:CRP/FNR family cyclic AMP-dependent transcriptional regulator